MDYLNEKAISDFISSALKEDTGEGDHTTLATIPHDKTGKADILFKDEGVLAGAQLAGIIMSTIEPDSQVIYRNKDGEHISAGESPLSISGSVRAILTAERVILNCMQRMSGIATYTREMVSLISHTKAKLLDTRKTTPNFRICEKWAVKTGGGENHRFGLFDMILIKDNHIDFSGGIPGAIKNVKEYLKRYNKDLKIEIETRSIAEVEQVLQTGGVERILLDNFDIMSLKEAVALINGTTETEASGGITKESIKEIAETGVDFISSGALTHSAKSLDISLKAVF